MKTSFQKLDARLFEAERNIEEHDGRLTKVEKSVADTIKSREFLDEGDLRAGRICRRTIFGAEAVCKGKSRHKCSLFVCKRPGRQILPFLAIGQVEVEGNSHRGDKISSR